jgi:hypothetical protein
MIPTMIETFWEIWLEAKKESKGKNSTLVFQELLRGIKTWNGSISLKHADNIKNKSPLFQKLLAAVFICHVKILLNGIRLDKKPKKIAVKLPAHDVFVQRCYETCGEYLYYHPSVITTESKTDDDRKKELTAEFTCKITTVIDDLIPWDSVVGDLSTDPEFNDDEEADEEKEIEDPVQEEEPPEDTGNLEDIANDSSATSSTEPIAQTPGGSETYAVTPSLNPPVVKKLGTEGESLFDDAKE